MLKSLFSLLLVLLFYNLFSQTLTGEQLLEKAIDYHDPEGAWNTFNGSLMVTMETPDRPNRDTEIKINLPKDYFYTKATRDTIVSVYEVIKDTCKIVFNGRTEFTEEEIKTHRLTCERATMWKDYYTYLYGLPMKLKDPGTNISETIERKTFKGKDYLVLKVTYDKAVGSHIWYFYFNPKSYAMEVYQFFSTDENENMIADSGEYILLTEEETINGIKMPKVRAWYYNKDDKYLGMDILKKN